MNWMWLFFSFSGRINRAKYWLATLITMGVGIAIFIPLFFVLGSDIPDTTLLVMSVVLGIPLLATILAVGAKRLHDRGKSGWWMLIFYFLPNALDSIGEGIGDEMLALGLLVASAAISIWALIELGILRGNAGPNRYGPDPLAAHA